MEMEVRMERIDTLRQDRSPEETALERSSRFWNHVLIGVYWF